MIADTYPLEVYRRFEQLIRRFMPYRVGDRILTGPGMDWLQFVRPKAAAVPWWLAAGEIPIAAFQGYKAVSGEASRVNLVNPGYKDLHSYGTWYQDYGWTRYGLRRLGGWGGVLPQENHTIIARFSDCSVISPGAAQVFGAVQSGAMKRMIPYNSSSPNKNRYDFGDGSYFYEIGGSPPYSGVMAMAKNVCYWNGVNVGTCPGVFGTPGGEGYKVGDTWPTTADGYVLAVAVFANQLSDEQVAALTAAMSAISGPPPT